jgi:uncharacterized protein
MDILLDTGFMVALIAKDSQHHNTATTMLKKYGRANFHTLWECVTEAGHFLNNQGRLTIHASRTEELKDMAAYMKKYPNVSKGKGADIADVSLVFLASRLKTSHIFTVDRADFDVYRTKTGKPFTRLWIEDFR